MSSHHNFLALKAENPERFDPLLKGVHSHWWGEEAERNFRRSFMRQLRSREGSR